MAIYPVFRQRFPADGYYSNNRKSSIFQYTYGKQNAPFAGSKNNVVHKWKFDKWGSGGSTPGEQPAAHWNLKEFGTQKLANQKQGYEYPTSAQKSGEALVSDVEFQNVATVFGEVDNLFESNDGSHIIGGLGVGNKCLSLTISDSTYRSGMFFFSGIKTPMVFESPNSGPIKFNVADCNCNYLEDVTGVSFDYSYYGSHTGAKDVHPYIKSLWMLYATHNYNGNDSDLSKELYMFTRKANTTLSGKLDVTPDEKGHVSSREYNVSMRISDDDRAHLVKYGLMGKKVRAGGYQQRAYWIGVAMRIEFPKKNTATVTRTINMSCMRPIISLDGSYMDTTPKHWAFGKDKRMFDKNTVFADSYNNPIRPYMG